MLCNPKYRSFQQQQYYCFLVHVLTKCRYDVYIISGRLELLKYWAVLIRRLHVSTRTSNGCHLLSCSRFILFQENSKLWGTFGYDGCLNTHHVYSDVKMMLRVGNMLFSLSPRKLVIILLWPSKISPFVPFNLPWWLIDIQLFIRSRKKHS